MATRFTLEQRIAIFKLATIVVLLFIAPILDIMIGIDALHRCSLTPIPLWVIVYGASLLINSIFNFVLLGYLVDLHPIIKITQGIINVLVTLFQFVWLVIGKLLLNLACLLETASGLNSLLVGSVWVFPFAYLLSKPDSSQCDIDCYRTAFVHLVILWIIFVLVFFVLIWLVVKRVKGQVYSFSTQNIY